MIHNDCDDIHASTRFIVFIISQRTFLLRLLMSSNIFTSQNYAHHQTQFQLLNITHMTLLLMKKHKKKKNSCVQLINAKYFIIQFTKG